MTQATKKITLKKNAQTHSSAIETDWSQGISIIIPTFRRPDGIKIALESVLEQDSTGRIMEIVVADNDPNAGAQDYVTTIAETSDLPIIYKHIPEPGVSNARNGALEIARGRYIIFLDDDMEATEGWVEQFLNVSEKYNAGIVFLPAIAAMPDPNDPLNQYMAPFFSRVFDAPEGIMDHCLGTGGCMLDLDLCQMPSPAFDPALNEVGGEDDFLFNHLMDTGTKVAWSPDALAHEHVPAKRATPEYLWTRNFAFGQGPTQSAADKGVKGILEIIKWMCVGAVQLLVYGSIYLVLRALGKPLFMKYLARTAQSLGKILWWGNFTPRLYGAATLKD